MSSEPGPDDLFDCRMCGDCCRGYGGAFVTPADVRAIADYIGADIDAFVDRYCQMSGRRPVLAEGPDGRCVFWDKLCTIHPVKPRMCRQWPFIRAILTDVQNWRSMADSCPGMRADAPDDAIRRAVRRKLAETGTPE
jgi:uncharacterized protein